MALRRRLERMREPEVGHPIQPAAEVETRYPDREDGERLPEPDAVRRLTRREGFRRDPEAQEPPASPRPEEPLTARIRKAIKKKASKDDG
jgi:hypothetical protein